MSYAVKTGTTQAFWIDQADVPEGHVRFDGDLPKNPVWDEKLQSIREKRQEELVQEVTDEAVRQKRAAIKAQVVDAIVDSILAGKTPSDPVMADVAAKVTAADAAVAAVPAVIAKL